jgi:N-acyl-L-homoserine lactone synthetase
MDSPKKRIHHGKHYLQPVESARPRHSIYDFLHLRNLFFVDTLGWHIPHDEEVEMDQNGNPKAWY